MLCLYISILYLLENYFTFNVLHTWFWYKKYFSTNPKEFLFSLSFCFFFFLNCDFFSSLHIELEYNHLHSSVSLTDCYRNLLLIKLWQIFFFFSCFFLFFLYSFHISFFFHRTAYFPLLRSFFFFFLVIQITSSFKLVSIYLLIFSIIV